VRAYGECAEEQARRLDADPRSYQVIDLDGNRNGDAEVAPEAADERSGQRVRRVTAIDRCNEGPRVGDDCQRLASASRRYCSARRLRSAGPSPEPT
jgi:hypothetical protein